MSELPEFSYHEATKHTPASVRSAQAPLDWNNRPNPFKSYVELVPVSLPAPAADTGYPALTAIAGILAEPRLATPGAAGPQALGPTGPQMGGPQMGGPLDAAEVARLLTLGAGVRRVLVRPPLDPVFFRTYACAGALYPVEIYLACAGINGLEAGLYHFSPGEEALRCLRSGDPRPFLTRAAGNSEAVAAAPVSIVLSGIPWRTCWKYRERGYRHLWWDSGMILANLLALSAASGQPCNVVLGFDDAELNQLLGLDGQTELALGIVPIGSPAGPPAQPAAEAAAAIQHPTLQLSRHERRYELIALAHRQTALASPEAAALWSEPAATPLPGDLSQLCPAGIEPTIRRRGSKRLFRREPVPLTDLAGLLDHAVHWPAGDWGAPLTRVALLAHDVDGLVSGAYRYGGTGHLKPLQAGDFRETGTFLCLEQALGGQGAATLFLLADLDRAYRRLGPRGYRAAQLEAGLLAGRIYLGAYACGFGATGLTFYDDEVRSFFATGEEPMLAVALGR
ncbi:MAG: SagB/ThcOx family dehydrogenase [Actinomycetota bacterium]